VSAPRIAPVDAPLGEQVDALERLVRTNPVANAILMGARQFSLPSWYLGAGAVAQTVWNNLHGFDAFAGIKDYDLVYFDEDDLTREAEQAVEDRVRALFADLNVNVDVTNEARVHVWYAERFGRSISPYGSSEAAIATWPTTATSVGVRHDGGFAVCAPYGLSDLFGMVVRPNKVIVPRSVYEAKAARWAAVWPKLTVLEW
jgi:hypothetical protein